MAELKGKTAALEIALNSLEKLSLDEFYGEVQIKVKLQKGSIVDVEFISKKKIK